MLIVHWLNLFAKFSVIERTAAVWLSTPLAAQQPIMDQCTPDAGVMHIHAQLHTVVVVDFFLRPIHVEFFTSSNVMSVDKPQTVNLLKV